MYYDQHNNIIMFAASDECDPVTGQCDCPPGLQGFYCMQSCSKGWYGVGCASKCACKRGDCHPVTGECRCPGGWTGADCSQPCPIGTFGPNCAHECYCHNGITYIYIISYVLCLMCHFSYLTSHVSHLISHVSCLMTHITSLVSYI